MAAIALDPASGRYRIRFYYDGVQYHRSIKTKDENKAQSILRRVDDTIQFLEQGRIVMPPDADPFTFILSDGKLTEKASVKLVRTLADLFATYQEQFTEGAKEANTRRTERIHAAHLQRLIGKTTALGTIKTGTLQEYVNNAETTKRYTHLYPRTIQAAMDLVFGEEEGPALMGDLLVKSPEESPKTTQGQ
jgi:hypothetical protein